MLILAPARLEIFSAGFLQRLLMTGGLTCQRGRFQPDCRSDSGATTLRDIISGDMAWIILLIAGLLEAGWATGLKYTDGFTRLVPSVLTAIAMGLSMFLLARAASTLPIGTAYAVWTGIGTIGAAFAGILLFGEPHNVPRIACILLIVAGVAGLRVFSA